MAVTRSAPRPGGELVERPLPPLVQPQPTVARKPVRPSGELKGNPLIPSPDGKTYDLYGRLVETPQKQLGLDAQTNSAKFTPTKPPASSNSTALLMQQKAISGTTKVKGPQKTAEEQAVDLAAGFCTVKLRQAVERYFALHGSRSLEDCFLEVWAKPPGQGRVEDWGNAGKRAILPSVLKGVTLPAQMQGMQVRLDSASHGAAYSTGRMEIGYNAQTLANATSVQDPSVAWMLTQLKGRLFHEAEHIFHPGASAPAPGDEAFSLYLANPGELRSHALQYALLYQACFPGHSLTDANLQDLVDRLKQTDPKLDWYVNRLAGEMAAKHPQHQELLTSASRDFREFMERFVAVGRG